MARGQKLKLPQGIYQTVRSNGDVRYRAVAYLGKYRKEKYFDTVNEAVRWREFAMSYVADGRPVPDWAPQGQAAELTKMSEALQEWMDSMERQQHFKSDSHRTRFKHAAKRLLEFFGDRPVSHVRNKDYIDFLRWLADGRNGRGRPLTKKTVIATHQPARLFFKYCVNNDFTQRDPTADTKPVGGNSTFGKRPRLTPEQVRELLEQLPAHWRLPALTQMASGLRVGELFGLQVGDVLDAPTPHTMRVMRQRGGGSASSGGTRVKDRTKNGEARLAFLHPELERLLRDHAAAELIIDSPDAFIFRLGPGQTYAKYSIEVKHALSALGVRTSGGHEVASHNLRFVFSVTLEESGISGGEYGRVWSRAMGHTDHRAEGVPRVTLASYALGGLQEVDVKVILEKAGDRFEALINALDDKLNRRGQAEHPGEDWITEPEALLILGKSLPFLLKEAYDGWIGRVVWHGAMRNVPTAYVYRPEVLAYKEFLDSRIMLTAVANQFGVKSQSLARMMKETGVKAIPRFGISLDERDALRRHVESGAEFRKKHRNISHAAAEIGVSIRSIDAAMKQGALKPVKPLGYQPQGGTWFSLRDLEAFAQARLDSGRHKMAGAFMSVEHAAAELGVSIPTAYRRVADGTLVRAKRGGRTVVTARSVEDLLRAMGGSRR